jgi:hypothetical protein
MSGYLRRIAARALSVADLVRPRVPGQFEPWTWDAAPSASSEHPVAQPLSLPVGQALSPAQSLGSAPPTAAPLQAPRPSARASSEHRVAGAMEAPSATPSRRPGRRLAPGQPPAVRTLVPPAVVDAAGPARARRRGPHPVPPPLPAALTPEAAPRDADPARAAPQFEITPAARAAIATTAGEIQVRPTGEPPLRESAPGHPPRDPAGHSDAPPAAPAPVPQPVPVHKEPLRREDAATRPDTIEVHIGSIEIRPPAPPPPTAVRPRSAPPRLASPRLTLDDYLRRLSPRRPTE